ncbi:MAG TPA: hypothetical protein VMP11_09710 [Verrucomicrobiae bacterium]|nr:hypothetical protein [Verrucomicrobiae bacterium]
MKRVLGLLVVMTLACQTQIAQSALEGDRTIPLPKYSPAQAIEKVSKYYRDDNGDPECFVISVRYGRPDLMGPCLGSNSVRGDWQEWSWFVTFAHPRKPYSEIVYRLRDNGEIYPLIQART